MMENNNNKNVGHTAQYFRVCKADFPKQNRTIRDSQVGNLKRCLYLPKTGWIRNDIKSIII